MLRWRLVVLEFSRLSAKKECRPTAGRSNENNERLMCDHVRLGGTLDAELPNNAAHQLPNSKVHGDRFERDAAHAHFTSK